MKIVAVASALASLAGSGIAVAQIIQETIAARLEYQVALPGGAWSSNVTINPGERVEWRAIISFTGTQNAVALGRIYYQPIFSNVDNTGTGSDQDQLGTWRNNGSSGQGNTTLQQGLLSLAEGADSSTLTSYGRVHYGFTSRSTTAGSSGPLIGHRHSGASDGSPAGEWMRIAGSNNPTWYPPTIPNGSIALRNQILWGVVSDNHTNPSNTWFAGGTQNISIFRQSFVASTDVPTGGPRQVTMTSEPASLGFIFPNEQGDVRHMTWAAPGDGGPTATIRCGVEYIPATITIVPTPPAAMFAAVALLMSSRRRRNA